MDADQLSLLVHAGDGYSTYVAAVMMLVSKQQLGAEAFLPELGFMILSGSPKQLRCHGLGENQLMGV